MNKKNAQVTKKELSLFNLLYAFLLIALPFIYVRTVIDPVVAPRQILLSIVLLAGAILLFFQKQPAGFYLKNSVVIFYGLLLVLYGISIAQSINVVESYYTLSKIGLFTAFFVFTTYLFTTGKLSFEVVLKCMIVFAAFVIISSFVEMARLWSSGTNVFKESNMYQVTSTFGHKNLLSSIAFLCMPFLFGAFLLLNKNWKITAALLVIPGTALVLMLQTRAVIAAIGLSFLVTGVVSLFLMKGERERRYIRLIGGGSALVLAVCLFIAVRYSEKFSLLTRTESAKERINLWHNTMEMIKDHPLTGVGAGNWQIHFPKYGLARFHEVNFTISEGLTNFQRPHNDFLWVFAETGIIGMIVYLCIFLTALFYLIRLIRNTPELNQKLLYLFFFFSILGYMLIAMVDFPLERIEHQVLIGLILAFVTSRYINAFEKSKLHASPLYLDLLVALAGAYGLWVGLNRYEGERTAYRLLVAHRQGAWEKMINEGNKAINTFYNMDPFSIPIKWYVGVGQFSLGDLASAKKSFEEAYQVHPYQVHVLNNYATCFEKEGDHAKAISMFEEMHRISPTFSDGIVNLAGAYYNAGRYEDAYRTIMTFKFDKDHPRSHGFYKVILGKKLELMLAQHNYSPEVKKRLSDCMVSDECILQAVKESQEKNVPFETYVQEK